MNKEKMGPLSSALEVLEDQGYGLEVLPRSQSLSTSRHINASFQKWNLHISKTLLKMVSTKTLFSACVIDSPFADVLLFFSIFKDSCLQRSIFAQTE